MIKRTNTASGAYLLKRAARLAERIVPKYGSRTEVIDGYLVRGERRGDRRVATVLDTPAYLVIVGASNTTTWPYSLQPPWQSGMCLTAPTGRDAFSPPGNMQPIDALNTPASIAPPVWSGDPPDPATTLSMTWGARPASGAGICMTTTAIEADSTKSYPFAYGTGRVWLMVGYANPTTTRDSYDVGETQPAEVVRGSPTIGVCLELSGLIAQQGAVAHPPRAAGGWDDAAAGSAAAVAWAFAAPFASGTRHPNLWAAVQVTKPQFAADYLGRRCVLLLRVADMTDEGTYSGNFWLIDPAAAYPGRAYHGNNYHLPSAPSVLSDGSLVLFDPYKSDLEEGGVTTCRYTLGLIRAGGSGVSASILHTSDIPLLNGASIENVDDAKLAQYHFEGADVSEDDVVVGVCFGYEFAEEPTATVYRVEGGAITSITVPTAGFVRCVYRVMPCHSGFHSLYVGHWGLHLNDPRLAATHLALGSTAGADKVTYIGNRKWAVYVSTAPQLITALGLRVSSGTLAVAVYDDATGEVNLAGVIRTDGGVSTGESARLGRMDCVVRERADASGNVTRKATLLATFGGGTWFPGNQGIGNGDTFISYDSGETWAHVVDYGGSPAGAGYGGTVLQPRADPQL